MSFGSGQCSRAGNHANSDPLELLHGVLASEGEPKVYPDDRDEPGDPEWRAQLRRMHRCSSTELEDAA